MNGRPSEFTSQVCDETPVAAADTTTPRALCTQCLCSHLGLGSIYCRSFPSMDNPSFQLVSGKNANICCFYRTISLVRVTVTQPPHDAV